MPVLPAYERRLQQANAFPYYDTALSRNRSIQTLLQGLSSGPDFTPDPLPKYDYATQALRLTSKADQLRQKSIQNRLYNNTPIYKNRKVNVPINVPVGNGGQPGGGRKVGGNLGALMRALAQQESGGRYGAVNSSSGALGKYQVMPSNVAGWSRQALGHSISTSQFLHSPALQDKIVSTIFGNYFRKYGAKGALSAWYSGDPNRWRDKSGVSNGPSVYNYVQEVLDRM